MPDVQVTISERAQRSLAALAAETGETVETVLERVIDDARRKAFQEGLAADMAALQADPEAWAEEQAERQLWAVTVGDLFDPNEESPYDDEEGPGDTQS